MSLRIDPRAGLSLVSQLQKVITYHVSPYLTLDSPLSLESFLQEDTYSYREMGSCPSPFGARGWIQPLRYPCTSSLIPLSHA